MIRILLAVLCSLVAGAGMAAEIDGPHCHVLDQSGGIVSTSIGDCPVTPPPDPDPGGACPFMWSTTHTLDEDINPLDGVPDSHNKACTRPASRCAVYSEPQQNSGVTDQIFGYSVAQGPYPAFTVRYRVWINAQPGAVFSGITVNVSDVCLSNVPRSVITIGSGASNVYLDGVRID